MGAAAPELRLVPQPRREIGKPIPEIAPAGAEQYEQLRIAADVANGAERKRKPTSAKGERAATRAERAASLEGKRTQYRTRKKWLEEVERETQAHRDYYAMRHEMRGWYALQPQNEAQPFKKASARVDLEGTELEWCGCRGAELEVDDIGLNLERCEGELGCGKIRPAGDEESWRWYAEVALARTDRRWCGCQRPAARDDFHGMHWCEECEQPIGINPLEPHAHVRVEKYRKVIEGLYRMDAVTLAFHIYDHSVLDFELKQQTGYGLGDGPDHRQARLDALRSSLGLSGPYAPNTNRAGDLAKWLAREELPDHQARHLEAMRPQPVSGDPELGIKADKQAPGGSVTVYEWHRARAKGQREKFERVAACGADTMLNRCTACELQGPKFKLTCGNHRLCLPCRAARIAKFQKKFSAGQQAHLQRLWNDPRRLKMNHQRTHRVTEINPVDDAPTRAWLAARPAKGSLRPVFRAWRAVRPAPVQGPARRQVRKVSTLKYGGVWGEKFVTLTLPHSGKVRDDVRELQRSWVRFIRLMRMHVEKDVLRHDSETDRKALMKYMSYCRVLEVTPGHDWKGHAHIHFWFVSPFIHQSVIAHLWGEAIGDSYKNMLVEAEQVKSVDELVAKLPPGRQRYAEQLRDSFMSCRGKLGVRLTHVWAPIVHINKVQSGDIAGELCKYLIKDGERNARGELELLDPKLFAMIYASLEGSRSIGTSRGLFLVVESSCHCQECGGVFRRWIESTVFVPESRGPPGQLDLGLEEGNQNAEPDSSDDRP